MLKLGKLLGKGSDGEVYEILNENKVVKYIQCSNYGIKNYLEFFIMKNIKHQNINTCIDLHINHKGLVKVIQEKAMSDLNVKLNKKRLKNIFYQAVNGLKYLNDLGIIHGDVKPSNMLLFEGDILKYTDFSLSRLYSSKSKKQLCSYFYRPPEIDEGVIEPSKIDVFSLGCSMYEIFYDEYYYSRSIDEKLHFPKNTKSDLLDLIYKMTNVNHKERYTFDDVCKHKYFKNYSFTNVKRSVKIKNIFLENNIIENKCYLHEEHILGDYINLDEHMYKKYNFDLFIY